MPIPTRRIPYTLQDPYRPQRPTTSKIIFLSCEGSVTEEEYFEYVSSIFDGIKSKIQFISVAEDAVHTHHKFRTPAQATMLSKARPKQLVERIDQFKIEKENIYQFSKYPDDEFWIITDVDNNWGSLLINEWNNTLQTCTEKKYNYAISNPFFEVWLLLHHDNPTNDDKKFAVTDEHNYESTTHFIERLATLGVPLKDKKHISQKHYNLENIKTAVTRAKNLHLDKNDFCPKYFSTTVYILLEKMISMLPEESLQK